MMNKAKRDVVMKALKDNNNECIYEKLFEEADKQHCDVLAAALKSLKKAKVVKFKGQRLLMPVHKDVKVKLVKPDYDPFNPS